MNRNLTPLVVLVAVVAGMITAVIAVTLNLPTIWSMVLGATVPATIIALGLALTGKD